MSRLARDALYIPGEHGLKLLVDLDEVSPVRCGRREFDGWFSIVERSTRCTVRRFVGDSHTVS